MIPKPNKEDIQKGIRIYNEIIAHEFRIIPKLEYINSYYILFENLAQIYNRYTIDAVYPYTNKPIDYKYYELRTQEEIDLGSYNIAIELWSNPNIAILNNLIYNITDIYVEVFEFNLEYSKSKQNYIIYLFFRITEQFLYLVYLLFFDINITTMHIITLEGDIIYNLTKDINNYWILTKNKIK